MKEIWFPDGVWEIIRSFMPIWKYPYNRVMLTLPRCTKKRYSIYTSATKQPRFKKVVYYHPYFYSAANHNMGFFSVCNTRFHIITYEIYTEN